MSSIRVYLAGGFYTDWRQKIKLSFPQLETNDPEHDNDQTACYRYVHDDLAAVAGSDLIIAYFPGGYSPTGMAAEMGFAAALRIPIFYIDTTGVPTLFLVGLSKRLFTSLDHFIDWWKEREAKGLPLV